tara:strand:+ start:181 stop:432 length:252 start_codon:yes stop_codon:yes gene_type:complete
MVNKKDIEDKVLHLISITLNIPKSKIDTNSSMKSIHEWDSLAHLNIVLAMEESLEIQLDLDELAVISSVQDWVEIFIKYQDME